MIDELKKRWKFLVVTYVFGYLFTIYAAGIPNIYYLQPVKVIPLLISLIMGNLFYRVYVERPSQIRIFYFGIVYGLPFSLLIIATFFVQQWLSYWFQMDFGAIIGLPIGPIHPR